MYGTPGHGCQVETGWNRRRFRLFPLCGFWVARGRVSMSVSLIGGLALVLLLDNLFELRYQGFALNLRAKALS